MVHTRPYTVSFAATAATAAVDFFELITGNNCGLALLGLFIGQTTELSDAAEEQLEWYIKRATGSYTSGSGGSSATPAKVASGSAAATLTAEVMNTTRIAVGSGTLTTLHSDTFNVRAGIQMWWTPETAFTIAESSALAIGLASASAPADSVSFVGTAYVAEYMP